MSDLHALLDAAAKYHGMGWSDGARRRRRLDVRDPARWPVHEITQRAYHAGFSAGQSARLMAEASMEDRDHA